VNTDPLIEFLPFSLRPAVSIDADGTCKKVQLFPLVKHIGRIGTPLYGHLTSDCASLAPIAFGPAAGPRNGLPRRAI
jgi:hypothetical protein